MPFVIEVEGDQYKWDPTKSTPSCPKSFGELTDVVRELSNSNVRSVIDFGCGNGRNSLRLVENFESVHLVEVEDNIPKVKAWVEEQSIENIKVHRYSEFKDARVKVDACLLSYVIHTIPSQDHRDEILETVKEKLTGPRLLVLASPSHDSKYTEEKIKDAEKYNSGIVRIYKDETFSFYENFSLDGLLSFLRRNGFEVLNRIPGNHRYIVMATAVD